MLRDLNSKYILIFDLFHLVHKMATVMLHSVNNLI